MHQKIETMSVNLTNTTTGRQEVTKALRSVVWIKYKIKDNEVFEKSYKYIEMYY
jgi:type I restriction enzyme R subunit